MVVKKTRDMVMTASIAAIIVILSFTPIGYIPLGFMNATTIHIPVIIGAILLGPKCGMLLGLTFGLTSMWKATFMPNATSFVFSPFVTVGAFSGNWKSVIICLVPRILIGLVAYYVYVFFMKIMKDKKSRKTTALMLAGIAGSMTNTLLVMNLIYFMFGKSYAEAASWAATGIYGVIMGIICMNGIPEAVIAGFLTAAVTKILLKIKDTF